MLKEEELDLRFQAGGFAPGVAVQVHRDPLRDAQPGEPEDDGRLDLRDDDQIVAASFADIPEDPQEVQARCDRRKTLL